MKKILLISFVGLCYCSAMNAQQKRTTNRYSAKKLAETILTNSYADELNKHFSTYELFELNTSSIYDQAEKEPGQFQFQLKMGDGHVWDITAEKFDVRSADYKLIVLGPNGKETFPKSRTTTYKGFVNGDPANNLRMSITPDYISALFTDGTHLYNIEPVTQYIQQGASTHYVVYESDAIKTNDYKCGSNTNVDQQTKQRAYQLSKTGLNLSAAACAQAEVALATTSDFVTKKGGGTQAGTEAYLIDFFNKAELYYSSLQIKNVLAGIVVSLTTQNNMTNANDVPTIRADFGNWATTGNGFGTIKHDVGIIITSKISSGIIGQVTFQGLCAATKSWHYGFVDVVVGPQNLAHEEGHFWGSPHDNDALAGYPTNNPNSCPTNDCVMMASNGFTGPVGKWSAQTVAYMEAWKTGQAAACVSSCVPIAPVAAFESDKSFGCGSLTVKFTDNSANTPTSWAWEFGDGGTSTLQNPTHTYSQVGNYSVKLIATNSIGSNTVTKTNYITVGSGVPAASVYVGPDTNGTIATFSSTNTNHRAQYFQTFAGLTLKSIMVYTGATAGKREFLLTDTTLLGAANTLIFKDTIVSLPANSAVKVNLNWDIPNPGYYALLMWPEGASYKTPTETLVQDVRRSTNATAYPYTIPSLVSIFNNLYAVSTKTPPAQWYVGYHWEVQSFSCAPVGIADLNGNGNLSIFPNPSNGLFTIKYFTNKEEKVSIEVYNLIGEKVFSSATTLSNTKAQTLDLTNRAKGVYIVRIIAEGHQSIQQIINE